MKKRSAVDNIILPLKIKKIKIVRGKVSEKEKRQNAKQNKLFRKTRKWMNTPSTNNNVKLI